MDSQLGRKKIFITSFEGLETKNVLRTPIFTALLARPDVEVVIFTKDQARADYHQREFKDPRIKYEVVETFPIRGLDRFFRWLKFTMLNTESTRLRRKMNYELDRNFVRYYGGLFLSWFLARSFFIKIARRLDRLLVKNNVYDRYFEKHKPDLVFLANIFYEPEVHFLRSAKQYKVRTIGFINSWDKVTARCVLRLLPDKFVVFNEEIKGELLEHNALGGEEIFVGGVPQYDDYFRGRRKSREEFFQEIGIDPQKKLILYAPIGGAFSSSDWEMLDFLHELHAAAKFGENAEFLVRFHPYDRPSPEELKKRPWLHWEHPGKVFSGKQGEAWDWDLSFDELWHLADTLRHIELLICFASSLSIDAAIFSKPVINLGFEVLKNPPLAKSPAQFYKMTHYKKALASGGIRLVESPEKLREWVRRYIDNPKLDREARQRLVKTQCQFLDGKSGERIGKFMLENLE